MRSSQPLVHIGPCDLHKEALLMNFSIIYNNQPMTSGHENRDHCSHSYTPSVTQGSIHQYETDLESYESLTEHPEF
jgi:hypothetical protein